MDSFTSRMLGEKGVFMPFKWTSQGNKGNHYSLIIKLNTYKIITKEASSASFYQDRQRGCLAVN